MFKIFFILLGILSVGFLNQQKVKIAPNQDEKVLKISVLANGKIFIDTKESSLQDVEKRLIQLKKDNGEVWYYRETANNEPPTEAMEVIKLIVKHKLPITLSSKPDFSDYIGSDGKSYPRKK